MPWFWRLSGQGDQNSSGPQHCNELHDTHIIYCLIVLTVRFSRCRNVYSIVGLSFPSHKHYIGILVV